MVVFSSHRVKLVVGVLPYLGLIVSFKEGELGCLGYVVSSKLVKCGVFSSSSAAVNHVVGYLSIGLRRGVEFGVGGRHIWFVYRGGGQYLWLPLGAVISGVRLKN
jgi:hypothetical protein